MVTPVTTFVSALVGRLGPLHLYSADATQSMRMGELAGRLVVHEVGVAEHLALALAAGRATTNGDRVLVVGFSSFLSLRGAECLRAIARERLPVTVLALLPGLSASRDGAAHQCLHEVGMLGSFAFDSFLWPADASAAAAAAEIVAGAEGPSWVALDRGEARMLPPWSDAQRVARWRKVRTGDGPTVLTYGRMVHTCLRVRVDCSVVEVIDPLSIAPATLRGLVSVAGGPVLVVEEQAAPGPLAARCWAAVPASLPVIGIGADPRAMQSGAPEEVLEAAGLGVSSIERSLVEIGV